MIKRFDKLNFDMLDTSGANYTATRLWDIFVPQSVRECHQYNPRLLEIPKEHQKRMLDTGEILAEELAEAERQVDQLRHEYFSQPIRPVLDVVNETLGAGQSRAGQKLVILGDPGSGKSSLIRYLALRWARIAEPTIRDTQPIPLIVDLRSFCQWSCTGNRSFVRYLEESSYWFTWPQGVLDRLIAEPGRVVLLLDGLDEVFDVKIREAVVNEIQRFTSEYPDAPILLTSRVVGYQPQRMKDLGFRHFMLQDLDADQIRDFLDHWHNETFETEEQAAPKRDRLARAIRDSKPIAMLAGNPLLLTMMAILNRNQELPRDRADLYAQSSRLLLHQWDTERTLSEYPGLSLEIGLPEKNDILRRVAWHMQAAPGGLKGNLIDGATLTRLIEEYLRDELKFPQARAAARKVVEHLRLRNFILCFVGAESYAFVHRTFLEYFCAAEFVHRYNFAKTLDIDGLIKVFDDHRREDEWREVLRLICGQIDEPSVGTLVEHLAGRIDLDQWDGETPLPELSLAIGCLSEVRNLARLESTCGIITNTLLRIYIPGKGTMQFHNQLLASQREIGSRWPETESLWATIQKRQIEVDEKEWASAYLAKFFATVRPDRKLLETLISPKNYGLSCGAIESLAEEWPDHYTRQLLERLANQDQSDFVRRVAVQSLAANWPDDDTRQLLAARAALDQSDSVRRVAVRSLAAKWPDDDTHNSWQAEPFRIKTTLSAASRWSRWRRIGPTTTRANS